MPSVYVEAAGTLEGVSTIRPIRDPDNSEEVAAITMDVPALKFLDIGGVVEVVLTRKDVNDIIRVAGS